MPTPIIAHADTSMPYNRVCGTCLLNMCIMESVEIVSCVMGHHIYQATWKPKACEKLECCREEDNLHDPYAVAMKKGETIVGHVPRKILAACSLFLKKEDTTITCTITGIREFSHDLHVPQGGFELPCLLLFWGHGRDI